MILLVCLKLNATLFFNILLQEQFDFQMSEGDTNLYMRHIKNMWTDFKHELETSYESCFLRSGSRGGIKVNEGQLGRSH